MGSSTSHLTKMRTIFYSIILGIGVLQTIVTSFVSIFEGFSDLRVLFGRIALGFSLLTWILTSILLAYNDRPLLSNIFTKKTMHMISFLIFTIAWLPIGIVLLSQAPTECNFERYSDGLPSLWCGFTISTGLAGVLLSILSATTVAFIRKSEPDINGNIAGTAAKVNGERAA